MKNRIRELREREGITQEELAHRLGVSRQTIIAIENDKYNPTLQLAFKFARIFGLSIEALFHYEEAGDQA